MKNSKLILNEARSDPKSDALSASKPYDLLVFIGRFQPFHKGHQVVVDRALKMSNNVLLIVGSSNKARSLRNPFTFEERQTMINYEYPSVLVSPLRDHVYNDTAWTLEVQSIVKEHALRIANPDGFQNNGTADIKIGLVGCEKDHSSYYLKLFPQWANESVQFLSPMNASDVRALYFENPTLQRYELDVVIPDGVTKFLIEFRKSVEYSKLIEEYDFVKSYTETWGKGPFLTCDSLVQVGGHVLLVKRGREYGHGLYALPGGFLGENEKFLDGAIRELKEETRLKVPVPVLKGSIVSHSIFDDPHRSERGRIITACYHFKLENELELPEVRGSDDAEWAGFVDFSSLEEKDFFEDHYHIIKKMMGI